MRPEKIRELDTAELRLKAREAEEQLFRLKLKIGMGQMEGLKKARQLKKDRARMLTVLREREMQAAAAAAQQGVKEGK